jgi:hypothetical protein
VIRRAVVVAVAVAGVGGCKGRGEVHKREGSAAAVEVVTSPTPGPGDGGAGGATRATNATGSPGSPGRPTGPVSDEQEPNDDEPRASALADGATVRGRIDRDGDVDTFAIDVKADGALALSLTGVDGVDLVLALADPAGQVIATSDRGGARAREGLPNVGVHPGRYLATVRAAKHRAKKPAKGAAAVAAGPSPVYELTASVAVPADGVEREPDDDRGGANDLLLGQPVTGWLGWGGDVDVWKLSVEALSAKDAFDVELSAIDGVALTVEVADGVGTRLLTRKGGRGEALALRGIRPALPPGAPPFHYLTIRGDHGNPETAYHLTVKGRVLGPDDELEPDDTPAQAQALPATAQATIHATWTPGDVDCFALAKVATARKVEITIDTPASADLAADLMVAGAAIAHSDHPGAGAAEQLTAEIPAGAVAVVVVRGAAKQPGGEGAYDLTIKDAGHDAMPDEEPGTTP